MQFITGSNRNQTYFVTLEDQVAAENSFASVVGDTHNGVEFFGFMWIECVGANKGAGHFY